MATDNGGLSTAVPITINIRNRNDFCPELISNSTALFFNTDLWTANSTANLTNLYSLEIVDGDNDTCTIDLLNFHDIFELEEVERNRFLLYASTMPEREYYILQLRLSDVVDESDQPCVRTIQLVLTIGTNETNQTQALDTAREYLEALHLTSKRSHSYFDLTLLNVILLFVLLSIGIIIALAAVKLIFLSSSSASSTSSVSSLRHRRRPAPRKLRAAGAASATLYRLQGPTETQLPLLENEPGDHSLTSSLIDGNSKSLPTDNINHSIDGDEQKQVNDCRPVKFISTDGVRREKFMLIPSPYVTPRCDILPSHCFVQAITRASTSPLSLLLIIGRRRRRHCPLSFGTFDN